MAGRPSPSRSRSGPPSPFAVTPLSVVKCCRTYHPTCAALSGPGGQSAGQDPPVLTGLTVGGKRHGPRVRDHGLTDHALNGSFSDGHECGDLAQRVARRSEDLNRPRQRVDYLLSSRRVSASNGPWSPSAPGGQNFRKRGGQSFRNPRAILFRPGATTRAYVTTRSPLCSCSFLNT